MPQSGCSMIVFVAGIHTTRGPAGLSASPPSPCFAPDGRPPCCVAVSGLARRRPSFEGSMWRFVSFWESSLSHVIFTLALVFQVTCGVGRHYGVSLRLLLLWPASVVGAFVWSFANRPHAPVRRVVAGLLPLRRRPMACRTVRWRVLVTPAVRFAMGVVFTEVRLSSRSPPLSRRVALGVVTT